jgi:hypothetical protein
MYRVLLGLAGAGMLLPAASPAVHAHEGPPFPIIVDRQAGPYVISVWADPDVGTGTFFVILAAPPGSVLPAENQVEVCVQPTSGRLPEACYTATRQNLRDRAQHYAEVTFDRQEMWRVRVRVSSAQGSGEVATEVEATPPGYGAWDLLIYGFPFILFGVLWLYAALRSRRQQTGRVSEWERMKNEERRIENEE